jgi:hypothetical protein
MVEVQATRVHQTLVAFSCDKPTPTLARAAVLRRRVADGDHELRIKLRACQGDDTMAVFRHRHVVTQALCDIRKSYLFFS